MLSLVCDLLTGAGRVRVLLDAHMIGAQETGNETYVANLWRSLSQLSDVDCAGAVQTEMQIAKHWGPLHSVCIGAQGNWPRVLYGLDRAARAWGADVLHANYVGALRCSIPQVVTVHDMSFRRHPGFFSMRDRLLFATLVPWSLRRAAAIVTVSEHAKSEISAFHPGLAGKVIVTPLAPAPIFTGGARALPAEMAAKWGVHVPYVLAVGNLQPRKNLKTLLEAFAQLKPELGPAQLVLVGPETRRASADYRRIAELGLETDTVVTGYVTDEELAALYRGARLFVYPSLYEGFGLPIVEAMACGTPVVCSCLASMPEVSGGAAVLVDPRDATELASAILEVWSLPALRKDLADRGLQRAAMLSWTKTAAQTVDIYKWVLRDTGADTPRTTSI